jgi:prepilin-type N-terminal cleavage/methylation domain-containing protein
MPTYAYQAPDASGVGVSEGMARTNQDGAVAKMRNRSGFTLIELLVVIGIILLLLAILLPVIGQVQIRAQTASTQAQMSRIMAACQMYYHDFNAYPGPIANSYLKHGAKQGADPFKPPGTLKIVTSSENLVLGLLGFLSPANPVTFTQTSFNPPSVPLVAPTHDVLSLNLLHPASYHYMDFVADELSPGPASNLEYAAGKTMTDTWVPEFIDRYNIHLPILYMRANAGNPNQASTVDANNQYNYLELADYGSVERLADGTKNWLPFNASGITKIYNDSNSAAPKNLDDSEATPFNDWWNPNPAPNTSYYLNNPNIGGGAVRGKDGFILISAGPDHTYGTHDDIIVTP